MGENEQGGMLRTVVVVGLVAIIAIVMIVGVVGLKSSLRTNTLMASSMGQNILKIDQSDPNKRFNRLGGYEELSYDADSGIYRLVLSTKSGYDTPSEHGGQGMYYGAGRSAAPKDYSAFLPGDKYQLTADMRSDDASLFSKVNYSMFFESGQNSGMYLHPTISKEWQHYETNGIRLDTWGAPMIYFTNDSGQPITIQIKNVKLIRKA